MTSNLATHNSQLITHNSLAPAVAILREAVDSRVVPGVVALVRWGGETVLHEAAGAAMLEPEYRPMRLGTVFDLASLTKPLATAPVILRLVERGVLRLDAPVGSYLPQLASSPLRASTIRQLLTHSSGIPAHVPVYARARTPQEALAVIAGLKLIAPRATRVEYSCLGFIVLGILAEQLTGKPLDRLAAEIVFEPLDLTHTGFCPRFPAEAYAATERGNDYERAGANGAGYSFHDWRTDYVPGAVHDGNAYYAMGGVSGNAGLFSTAEEVGIIGQMWLNGGEYDGVRILDAETVALATRDLTPGLNFGRGLGWLIGRPAPAGDTAPCSYGSRLSPRVYGHTGFTGTSIWIDPDDELVIVLLTNRVHPVVDDGMACIALRHRFQDAVAQALKKTS